MSPDTWSGLHRLFAGDSELERRKTYSEGSNRLTWYLPRMTALPDGSSKFPRIQYEVLSRYGQKSEEIRHDSVFWSTGRSRSLPLGFSSRSADQIHEKVRKAVDRCRRSIVIEKRAATKGLAGSHHSDIPYYLEPLKQVLLNEAEEAAMAARATMVTVDEDDGHCDSKEAVQNEIRALNALRPTSTPSFGIRSLRIPSTPLTVSSDVPSRSTPETENGPSGALTSLFDDAPSTSSTSCMDRDEFFDSNITLALLQAELRAVEMKREYYAKKMKLAEAQMELTALQIEQYRLSMKHNGSKDTVE
ncbi:hypothetical protein COOONC_10998 [Cooperia oncophora]